MPKKLFLLTNETIRGLLLFDPKRLALWVNLMVENILDLVNLASEIILLDPCN